MRANMIQMNGRLFLADRSRHELRHASANSPSPLRIRSLGASLCDTATGEGVLRRASAGPTCPWLRSEQREFFRRESGGEFLSGIQPRMNNAPEVIPFSVSPHQ